MIITKERIRHNGKHYGVNARIEDISEKDAERLVNLGVAFYPETVQVPSGNDDFDSNNDGELNQNDSGDFNPNDGEDSNDDIDLTPEQAAEELTKLFDYNGLKEAAKTVGLEFAGNISKANLIALILEQNKAEAVFDLAEEDEE
jgi:hypothetical protein